MSNGPDAKQIYDVIDATWPAAEVGIDGVWTLRRGEGGGSRVSAATANASGISGADIQYAAGKMTEMGQTPFFMIREGEERLDAVLADEGYQIKDQVNLYACPIAVLTDERPAPLSGFVVWPPLACQKEIWNAGGIGPARLAVMERADCVKTTILGRVGETPVGSIYLGISGECAMIHALEVLPSHRRRGLAAALSKGAAFWARDRGAKFMTLMTTKDNVEANALYASLGMTIVGGYHYRIKQ